MQQNVPWRVLYWYMVCENMFCPTSSLTLKVLVLFHLLFLNVGVHLTYQYACFMLVRSAMFGGTLNLVSHVWLLLFLERPKIIVCLKINNLPLNTSFSDKNIFQNGVNVFVENGFKKTRFFVKKLKILYISDITVWFQFRQPVVQVRIK